jgi:hypothetical protein
MGSSRPNERDTSSAEERQDASRETRGLRPSPRLLTYEEERERVLAEIAALLRSNPFG